MLFEIKPLVVSLRYGQNTNHDWLKHGQQLCEAETDVLHTFRSSGDALYLYQIL